MASSWVRVSVMSYSLVLAWEEPFRTLLERTRLLDTELIQKSRNMSVTSINAGRASPVLAGAISILTIAFTAPQLLTASTIFTALMAFQSLRLPLIVLPQNLIQIANGRVALTRIVEYLNLPEFERPEVPTDAKLAVKVSNASFEVGPERKVMGGSNGSLGHQSHGGSHKSVGGGGSFRRLSFRTGSVRFLTTAPGAAAARAGRNCSRLDSCATRA